MATELATAYVSLIPSARGIKGNITRELGGAGHAAAASTERSFQGASGRVGSTFKGMFTAVAAGGALAIGGAFAAFTIGKDLLDTGAEMESWRLKAQTVFEGSNADIQKWADKNAESFGLTDDQLAGMAANFGDLLKPMGFTSDQAATMSKDVVGLSGALSAWTGGKRTTAEVSEILSAAMLGEREALKSLGISISENDVQTQLAKKGQEGLTGAALEQAKAVATQELIFAKSVDAQKAWAEGGNKALTTSNKLKSQFGEMKEKLVTALLPALVQAGQWLGDTIPKALAVARLWFGTLSAWWQENGPQITETARRLFTQISDGVMFVVAAVRDHWPQISATITEVMDTVRTIVTGVVDVVTTLWDNFGNNILEFAKRAWGPLRQIVSGALEVIRGIINTVTALIKGDWGGVWDGIKQIVHGAFNAIVGFVKYFLEQIRTVIGVALEILGSIFKGAFEGIKSAVGDGIQWVLDKLLGLVSFVTGIPGKITTAASGMFDGIKNAFKSAINWIIDAWNGLEFKIPGFDPPGPGPTFAGFTLGMPDIPKFHDGGIYRAPPGQTEGLALLRDGEEVLTPDQRGGGLHLHGVTFGYDRGSAIRDLDWWARKQARDAEVMV